MLLRLRRQEVNLRGPWCPQGVTGVSILGHPASRDTEHQVNNISKHNVIKINNWSFQVNLLSYKIESSSEIWESDDTIGAEADEMKILPVIVVMRI